VQIKATSDAFFLNEKKETPSLKFYEKNFFYYTVNPQKITDTKVFCPESTGLNLASG